jgi:hypothetical protein
MAFVLQQGQELVHVLYFLSGSNGYIGTVGFKM